MACANLGLPAVVSLLPAQRPHDSAVDGQPGWGRTAKGKYESLFLTGFSLCLSFPFSLWTDLLSHQGSATSPQTTRGPDAHCVQLLLFTDKEIEAQRGEGTGPRLHSEMVKQGLECRSLTQKPVLSHMSCKVKFSSQASLDLPSSLPPPLYPRLAVSYPRAFAHVGCSARTALPSRWVNAFIFQCSLRQGPLPQPENIRLISPGDLARLWCPAV